MLCQQYSCKITFFFLNSKPGCQLWQYIALQCCLDWTHTSLSYRETCASKILKLERKTTFRSFNIIKWKTFFSSDLHNKNLHRMYLAIELIYISTHSVLFLLHLHWITYSEICRAQFNNHIRMIQYQLQTWDRMRKCAIIIIFASVLPKIWVHHSCIKYGLKTNIALIFNTTQTCVLIIWHNRLQHLTLMSFSSGDSNPYFWNQCINHTCMYDLSHLQSEYCVWPKVFECLTITPIWSPFLNCCHNIGRTQSSRMSLYDIALQFSFAEMKGSKLVPAW